MRKVTFADGSTETLCRFIDVLREGGGVPRPYGGPRVSVDAVESEARAERLRKTAEQRARRELRWALASIGADRLLSATFHANLQDRKIALAVWARFIRLVKARHPNWKFAAVMELQERGAIHFHAGVKGFQPVKYLRACWRVAAGEYAGNIDVQPPRDAGVLGLAGYIGKYISKAFAWLPKGARRYFASRDRDLPVIDRWWINYVTSDGDVIETVYRATCGVRAVGARQWLSPDGRAYVVSCSGPPRHDDLPF